MAGEWDRPTGATHAAERLTWGQRFTAQVAVIQTVKDQFGHLDLWFHGVHLADVAGPRPFRLSPSRPRDLSSTNACAMGCDSVRSGRGKASRNVTRRQTNAKPMPRLKPLAMRKEVMRSSGTTQSDTEPAERSGNVKQNPPPRRERKTEIAECSFQAVSPTAPCLCSMARGLSCARHRARSKWASVEENGGDAARPAGSPLPCRYAHGRMRKRVGSRRWFATRRPFLGSQCVKKPGRHERLAVRPNSRPR